MSPDDLETLASADPFQAPEEPDGRRRRGRATREQILDVAADVGSVEGLEGLTLGRLASELGISKSGLFAHFGSKEELQLATMEHGRQRFVDHVIRPSRALPRGRARLERLLDDWLRYYEGLVFKGGCFLDNVAAEYDSRPDGPVRDQIKGYGEQWLAMLVNEVAKAVEAGDLAEDTDPEQLGFELKALGAAANHSFQLSRDPKVFARARAGMRARLDIASR